MQKPVSSDFDRRRIKVLPVPPGFLVRKMYELVQKDYDEISFMDATPAGRDVVRTIVSSDMTVGRDRGDALRQCSPVVGVDGWYFYRKPNLTGRSVSWVEYKNTAWIWDNARPHWGKYMAHVNAGNITLPKTALAALLTLYGSCDSFEFTEEQIAIVRRHINVVEGRTKRAASLRVRKSFIGGELGKALALAVLKAMSSSD